MSTGEQEMGREKAFLGLIDVSHKQVNTVVILFQSFGHILDISADWNDDINQSIATFFSLRKWRQTNADVQRMEQTISLSSSRTHSQIKFHVSMATTKKRHHFFLAIWKVWCCPRSLLRQRCEYLCEIDKVVFYSSSLWVPGGGAVLSGLSFQQAVMSLSCVCALWIVSQQAVLLAVNTPTIISSPALCRGKRCQHGVLAMGLLCCQKVIS